MKKCSVEQLKFHHGESGNATMVKEFFHHGESGGSTMVL